MDNLTLLIFCVNILSLTVNRYSNKNYFLLKFNVYFTQL
jgi:hypothetical protein